MGRTNDTVKILAAIQKNMDKKSWPCIYGGCDQHAINSHLLQRHGVLDRVVENGHLYEVKRCDYYKWNRNPPIEFKMVGLNRAISLPLFCHEHDSRLFRSIEQDEIDCSDYRMQLLLSYRTVCAEIRKKEMNIEFLGRMKKFVGAGVGKNIAQFFLRLLPISFGESLCFVRFQLSSQRCCRKDCRFLYGLGQWLCTYNSCGGLHLYYFGLS